MSNKPLNPWSGVLPAAPLPGQKAGPLRPGQFAGMLPLATAPPPARSNANRPADIADQTGRSTRDRQDIDRVTADLERLRVEVET